MGAVVGFALHAALISFHPVVDALLNFFALLTILALTLGLPFAVPWGVSKLLRRRLSRKAWLLIGAAIVLLNPLSQGLVLGPVNNHLLRRARTHAQERLGRRLLMGARADDVRRVWGEPCRIIHVHPDGIEAKGNGEQRIYRPISCNWLGEYDVVGFIDGVGVYYTPAETALESGDWDACNCIRGLRAGEWAT